MGRSQLPHPSGRGIKKAALSGRALALFTANIHFLSFTIINYLCHPENEQRRK